MEVIEYNAAYCCTDAGAVGCTQIHQCAWTHWHDFFKKRKTVHRLVAEIVAYTVTRHARAWMRAQMPQRVFLLLTRVNESVLLKLWSSVSVCNWIWNSSWCLSWSHSFTCVYHWCPTHNFKLTGSLSSILFNVLSQWEHISDVYQ